MKTFKGFFVNAIARDMIGPKDYSFKTNMDVKQDDVLVVDSAAGLAVVKVMSVDEVPDKKASKWAFQMVDVAALQEILNREARREVITAKLEEKLRARKEVDRYAHLAETDPEAAEFLKELQDMDK